MANITETNEKFKEDYKNDQDFIVRKIRTQYTEKESTGLEQLKKLDQKVKLPATVFAYVLGSIGAVVFGAGMSLILTDIAETLGIPSPMVTGIIIGVIGIIAAVVNYPAYKAFLGARRKKYADKIIELSNKITEG